MKKVSELTSGCDETGRQGECVCVSQLCSYVPEKTPVSCGAAPQTSAHIYFLQKISNTQREATQLTAAHKY